ncbi:uncharacterized protein LOC125044371 [Penaeus chinensis]|uniref:uncharacterized protein LOC125044371 n=1 Tax=Penaeus chinensis TaxID=139456 RepID=UPI001FB5B7DE|nr:uncharacterized protein LOC125044371 [Penaeus chinensis]
MNNMKIAVGMVLLLATLHGAKAWFCYSQTPGSTEKAGWVFCPSTSCYTVAVSLLGMGDAKRGCADKTYPDACQEASAIAAAGNVCFCNTLLCNDSSAKVPALSLPFLALAYLLFHRLM